MEVVIVEETSMTFVIWPTWDLWTILGYSFFGLLALSFGYFERKGLLQLNYSKFRKERGISSRLGMFVLYATPMLVYILVSQEYMAHASLMQWILWAAIVLHFAKRCLEVLFVHKYSGPIDVLTVTQIAASYSLATFLLAKLHSETIPQIDWLFVFGLGLYGLGEIFNFYHHALLAQLRRGDQEKSYVIPQAGLFKYVTTPHYFMELWAWLGLALMSRHLAAYMIFVWTCGYLFARACRTDQWYRSRFPEYPKERKVLVPFAL
jgi:very-long-chain enoyl-CoA reductase